MAFEPLTVNTAQICYGLSKLGLTPPTALINLIENAVTAGAKNIIVKVVPEIEGNSDDDSPGNVREYLVIDDESGMDERGIKNALALWSALPQEDATAVPKAGNGLKSAAFTQSDTLEVLSSPGKAPFIKYRVSLKDIFKWSTYGVERLEVTDEDNALIQVHLQSGRGTIIRITDIRQSNNYSIRATINGINSQMDDLYSPEYKPHIRILVG